MYGYYKILAVFPMLYILIAYFMPSSLCLLLLRPYISSPFPLLPDKHWFVLYMCESASFCYIH